MKHSPDAVTNENLYKLSGKRVAVDASLILYQQLLKSPNGKIFKNSKGKITSHITGVFYKIMNYISLNIEMIFIFDGKPPDNKQDCINQRKEKSKKAKEASLTSSSEEEKQKLEKSALRLTSEMVNDVKKLLNLMGISYIHPDVGEGEAYASEHHCETALDNNNFDWKEFDYIIDNHDMSIEQLGLEVEKLKQVWSI